MSGVKIFVSYCHQDRKFREELFKHMKAIIDSNIGVFWGDQSIQPGNNWESEIRSKLNEASIILILVSVDYINSKSCIDEMNIALSKYENGEAVAIPVPIRSCDWLNLPLGKLQAATEDGNPIDLASNRDKAWLEVVKSVAIVINRLSKEQIQKEIRTNKDTSEILEGIVSDEDGMDGINKENPKETYSWVRLGDKNQENWSNELDKLLEVIENNSPDGTDYVRKHGSKILIDYKRGRFKTLSRLVISDTSGLIGSPGYQIKVYPTLARDYDLPISGRYRWAINSMDRYYFVDHSNNQNTLLNVEQLSEKICNDIENSMKNS